MRKDNGEFTEPDDFSNALFHPLETEAIAIRAVLYEINALIESVFHTVASEAYFSHQKYKNKKETLGDISSLNEISKIKFVSDLPFGEICNLIEKYYSVKLGDLPSRKYLQFVRQTVNSFKHNNGFKDFRKNPDLYIGDRFTLKREGAYKAISEAEVFIKALWHKLE